MNRIIRGSVMTSELKISDSELSARLGRPAKVSDADIQSVCLDILGVCDIKFVATRLRLTQSDGEVSFGSFSVKSDALSRYFSDSNESFLFVLTLGYELDRLIMKKRALSISRGFIYDAVASAIAEAACDVAQNKISAFSNVKGRFSPGYSDCPLELQGNIVNLLQADKYIGVKLLDSMLMSPMKSVSAFIKVLP